MNKMMKMLKKIGKWYFNKYMEFYAPMIKNNVNPFTV